MYYNISSIHKNNCTEHNYVITCNMTILKILTDRESVINIIIDSTPANVYLQGVTVSLGERDTCRQVDCVDLL